MSDCNQPRKARANAMWIAVLFLAAALGAPVAAATDADVSGIRDYKFEPDPKEIKPKLYNWEIRLNQGDSRKSQYEIVQVTTAGSAGAQPATTVLVDSSLLTPNMDGLIDFNLYIGDKQPTQDMGPARRHRTANHLLRHRHGESAIGMDHPARRQRRSDLRIGKRRASHQRRAESDPVHRQQCARRAVPGARDAAQKIKSATRTQSACGTRMDLGLAPVQRLNARENAAGSENPTR